MSARWKGRLVVSLGLAVVLSVSPSLLNPNSDGAPVTAFRALESATGIEVMPATAWASSRYGTTWGEIVNCVRISVAACAHARDAMQWAYSVTRWRFPRHRMHNDIADAFRHCIWTGAMSHRLGVAAADKISTRHEQVEGQSAKERRMDLNNNVIGIGVGREAVARGGRDQWGYVWKTCERHAYNKRLFGLNGRGKY